VATTAVLAGGNYDRHTLYIEPTLITDLTTKAAIMNDEIFGPLVGSATAVWAATIKYPPFGGKLKWFKMFMR